MASAPIELYNDGHHVCLSFDTLVEGTGIQANQFLIAHGEDEALLDPGGNLTFVPLSLAVARYTDLANLDYVLASHQDPDIIAAMDRWMERTKCKVVVSALWSRFLPHLVSSYQERTLGMNSHDRIIAVPDEGTILPLGETHLKVLPAHFLHSVGNLQFYDPVSKILFSGDMGASVVEGRGGTPVEDFDAHISNMAGFHRRYMNCNKVCRLWANMVRELDVEMIVPQHGRHFKGREMVNSFLDWISNLECGTDLLTQRNYQVPR
ncbi:MAG: MBL fold metallo-hydrolase [Gammaproteobacteria bacterium]